MLTPYIEVETRRALLSIIMGRELQTEFQHVGINPTIPVRRWDVKELGATDSQWSRRIENVHR